MKFSKKWLQMYSTLPLPETKKLEEIVTFNAFEIEEVTSYEGDDVIDIKVLPNRAHDALGHRGMARDITALMGSPFVDPHEYYQEEGDISVATPSIEVEDTKACTRFMSVCIEGVEVTDSPEWLKQSLLAIGQKSINSIVDITNYVQFAINKPMHAYDKELVVGSSLIARYAKEGETLITLDEKTLALTPSTLVISDTEKPLGLAGIKGGKSSGVGKSTTSLILESANFNPTLIRKTAQRYSIRTDASKRFENELSDALVEEGLRMTIALIKKLNPNAKVSPIADVFPKGLYPYKVGVSLREINGRLGTTYTKEEVLDVFSRLGFVSTVVPSPRDEVLSKGEVCIGVPYKRGASVLRDAPSTFDCSSFTSWLYTQAGYQIPRIAIDQYVFSFATENPSPGDLVFTNTGVEKTKEGSYYSQVLKHDVQEKAIRTESVEWMPGTSVPEGVDHCGIYLGDGYVLHTSSVTGKVVKEKLSESEVFSRGYSMRAVIRNEEERIVVTVPHERLDIRIREDLIEEVGRVMGLSLIKGVLPLLPRKGLPHKRLYYENKIKSILYSYDFSEIMTYSFGNEGEVSIVKGLASDKEKLRATLSGGVLQAFQMNMLNAPLLAIDVVKMYEFGTVFSKEGERRQMALVIDDGKKKSSFTDDVDLILSNIKRALSLAEIEYETVSVKPYCIVIDFDALIAPLPEPTSYEPLPQNSSIVSYQAVSPYPFISRDIALWASSVTTWEDIRAIVNEVHNPLVARVYLFDTFSKQVDGVEKVSYAFRLVFVSHERTLTDDEVNLSMETYYTLLKEKGFEIR